MQKNRKLLFICDLGHVGRIWYDILNHLADLGWEIVIYSPKLSKAQLKFFGIYKSRKVTIFFSKFRSPYRKFEGYPRVIRKIIYIFMRRNKKIYSYRNWVTLSAKEVSRIFQSDKIIILSSSSPIESHIIAQNLSHIRNQNWLADYRDLWSLNHNTIESDLNKLKMERELTKDAVAFITTSKSFGNKLKEINSGIDIYQIHNGFEYLREKKHISKKKVKIISYVGQLYPNFQDYRLLIQAFSKYVNQNPNSKIKLQIGGFGTSYFKDEFDSLKISKHLIYLPVLNYQEAVKTQENADCLILFNTINLQNSGVLQTKLYEYISMAKPILAIGKRSFDESEEILEKINHCVICETEDQIIEFLSNFEENVIEVSEDIYYLNQYSRKIQSMNLNEILSKYYEY